MASDWDKVIKMVDEARKFVAKKSTLESIGKHTVDQIRKRTRVGKGVDTTQGPQVSLSIKDKTKEVRRSIKSRGGLSSKTSPAKANLTRTGSLLDGLNASVNSVESSVTIRPKPSDQRKANELEKQGHKFLNLTKGEFKQLVEFLVRGLLKTFNK